MGTQNFGYSKLGALLFLFYFLFLFILFYFIYFFETIPFSFSNFGQSQSVVLQIRLALNRCGCSKIMWMIKFCRCSKLVMCSKFGARLFVENPLVELTFDRIRHLVEKKKNKKKKKQKKKNKKKKTIN